MAANSEGCTIELDGSPVTLRYTLGAAKKVNATFGDFVAAYKRVSQMDFTAVCHVVAAALGKEFAEVEDTVFKAGIASIAPHLSDYLAWLSNGGRDPRLQQNGEEESKGNA